jgi:nitrous oxidase accessory protein NosD
MHKRLGTIAALILLTVSCIIIPLPVNAASRTIVVPDDYSTIADAIANADNGDTIFVRAGTYDGPIDQSIVIDKSISVVGENASTTQIKFHPKMTITWILTAEFFSYTDAITVNANGFSLSNLTLSPRGFITIKANDAQIVGNNVTSGSGDGLVVWGSNCKIANNQLGSLANITGSYNTFEGNIVYRLAIHQNGNTVGGNTIRDLWLSNTSQNIIYHNNFLTSGLDSFPITGDQKNGANSWNNNGEGNYWENYKGKDSNSDGIGDSTYTVDPNNIDHYPLMKPWTGNLSASGFGLWQTLLIAFAVVLVAVGVFLAIYVRRRAKRGSFAV